MSGRPGPAFRRLSLAETGSTNALALERAAAGESSGLWVTAERQTGGRGRRGRAWVSEPGNLYASLLLIDPAPANRLATLPLAAALGVYEALKPDFSHAPQALSIKWPNDILADGAKICGILLESAVLADGRIAVVIGCGVNVASHPQQTLYRATSLADCAIGTDVETLFARLALAMDDVLARWEGGRGFPAIREDWLRAAAGLGGPVTVNLPAGAISGTFVELDRDGYLCLQTLSGDRRKIAAGDVFLGFQQGQPK